MPRPPADPSGPAHPTQVRLSPRHLAILDSFCNPNRNRSGTIAWLLERAEAGRALQEAQKQKPPT